MKILIKNMGPVEYFELDLDKSFTVIYGGNNIGKSYAMQVCYLLMKHIYPEGAIFRPDRYYYRPRRMSFDYQLIAKNLIRSFYKKERREGSEIDITSDVQSAVINGLFLLSAKAFFAACKNTFKEIKTHESNPFISLNLTDFYIAFDIMNEKISSDYNVQKVLLTKKKDAGRLARETSAYLRIFIKDDENKETKRLLEHGDKAITKLFYAFADELKRVYYLPSSRSGIYTGLSSIGPAIAQLAQNRTFFTQGFVVPSISEPVSDYYLTLMDIKSSMAQKLEPFAIEIEEDVLRGSVIFDAEKGAYQYQSGEIRYDLTQTSSMIAEISPIVAYLKYIVRSQQKTVIFIEEPEAHLHPENQVRLIEILAKLATKVNLVISSHSNYIFNKLNNMILDGQLNGTLYNPILMEPEGSFGKARNLDVADIGVKDENFTDITELLWDEREEIIERRNEENADD